MRALYRQFYIDAYSIKNEIHNLGKKNPDAHFSELIGDELHRVNQFVILKQQELTMEMQLCARNLKAFTRACSNNPTSSRYYSASNVTKFTGLTDIEKSSYLAEAENTLLDLSNEIVHLHEFVRTNFSTLLRLSIHFDEQFKRSSSPWFLAQLIKEPFACVDLDRLLIMLSLSWDKHRQAVAASKGLEQQNKDTWKPPESFVRNTTKYWVRPEHVPAAKAIIVRYVPYLIFGYSSEELEYLIDPFELGCSRVNDVKEGQLVSSVYLDSEDGHCYYERLKRFEGAELLRCRWYGENDGDPYKEIFIERKTHHEGWVGESSTKERFSLPQKRVYDFLQGKVDIDEWANYLTRNGSCKSTDKKIANLLRLGREISATIQEHKLRPMVRTSYLRSAFQSSTSNDVRVSLDVNLCMVNEYQSEYLPPWCRVSEEILSKDEVVRFPFAVLEVKLQCEQPAWVSQMLCAANAIMVYKFSKFQHGMAFLHRQRVAQFGVPHWIPDFENRGFVPGFSIPVSQNDFAASTRMSQDLSQVAPQTSPTHTREHTEPHPSASRYNALLTGERKSLLLASFYPGTSRRRRTDVSASDLAYIKPRPPMSERSKPNEAQLLEAIHANARTVVKMDPKSVFAAERTLLHYIQKCLVVLALAFALMEMGAKRFIVKASGLILCVAALVTILLSWLVFDTRLTRIVNRRTKALYRERLDSQWGPLIIYYLLSSALGISLMAGVLLRAT